MYRSAISSDDATNNDTIMESLELLLAGDGIEFSVEETHVHCMPHSVHLAAMSFIPIHLFTAVQVNWCIQR